MDVHVCFINKTNATTFVKSSDLLRSYTGLCKSIKIILKPHFMGPKDYIRQISVQYAILSCVCISGYFPSIPLYSFS